MRYIILLTLLLLKTINNYAQEADTVTFAKDRFLTSLYGSLSNQQVDVGSGGNVTTTGYTIGTKSGRFIKNNWVLGLNFALSKSDFNNGTITLGSEDLTLGLWSRLYFAVKGSAALYVELTPYYSAIYRQSIIDNGSATRLNEEISGNGYGVIPGFGFTYIINRSVGFGMTISMPFARIHADTKDIILNTVVSDTYYLTELQFGFNFQIYLDQFFF